MPDEPKPEDVKADPFDLGDTSLYPSTDKPTVQPVQPAETPAAPRDQETGRFVKPEHPEYLVRRALDLGYSDEDIADVSTAKLHKIVHLADRQQLTFQSELARERTLQESQTHRPPPGAHTPTPSSTGEADELGSLREELDPRLLGILEKLHAKASRVEALERQIAGLQQSEERRTAETRDQWIDRLFAENGDEARLGKGSIRSIKADSAEYARRLAVVAEAIRQAGPKATPEDQIRQIPKVIKMLGFGLAETPEPAKPVNNGSRIEPDIWKEAGLARPSHRSGAPEPKGEAVATERLTKKMQDQGLLGDSDIMDGLPE